MPASQYTSSFKAAKTPRILGCLAWVAVAAATMGLPGPSSAQAVVRTTPGATLAATPTWNDVEFLDYCRILWWFLNGDVAYFNAHATTPESAMELVNERYAALGAVPADLTTQEQAELRQVLTDAQAMIEVAPTTLELNTVNDFLATIDAMWVDLGGYPQEIGS